MDRLSNPVFLGFPSSSAGKESTCNAGDPASIPGLGRSAGEGIGYPIWYFGASLVAQLEKNPPAMQETPVQFLGQEDPLEKGKATHPSRRRQWHPTPVLLPGKSQGRGILVGCHLWDRTEFDTTEAT